MKPTFIPLSKHYQTLPSRDALVGVGLRVFHKFNEEYLYILSVEGGLWCGKKKDGDFGNFYAMSDLLIDESNLN